MMMRIFLLLLLGLLAGCGFQPRGVNDVDLSALGPVRILGQGESNPLVRELRYQLQQAGAQVIDTTDGAATLIRIHQLKRKSSVFSVDKRNKALEYEVDHRVTYSVESPPGKMRLNHQQLRNRSIVYAPGGALLGRIREAELQKSDAYRDLVQQLLQRLRQI